MEKLKKCKNCEKKFDIKVLKEVITKGEEKFFYCEKCYEKVCDKCKEVFEELFQLEKNKYCGNCHREIIHNKEMVDLKKFLKENFTTKGIQGILVSQARKILLTNYDITPKDVITTINYMQNIKKIDLEDSLVLVPNFITEALDFEKELERLRIVNGKKVEELQRLLELQKLTKQEEKENKEKETKPIKPPHFYGLIDMKTFINDEDWY